MTADGLHRSWRMIAQELARETDPRRVLELSEELSTAMEAQGLNVERAVPLIYETLRPKSETYGMSV